jgi:hypothetical protein
LFDGDFYYPSGPTVFFDGNVMVRSGTYRGVGLYAASPFTTTTGTFAPSTLAAPLNTEPPLVSEIARPQIVSAPSTVGAVGTAGPEASTPPSPTRIESIPAPVGLQGVFITYDGATWRLAGEAVKLSADRFVHIGDYRGFPVYHERTGNDNLIWVSVVDDGPVAPYSKR